MELETDTGPEVYETSDVESLEVLPGSTEPVPDVETPALDAGAAAKQFEKNVIVDAFDVVDFLGSVARPQAGFRVGRVAETPQERLRRISAELDELAGETGADEALERLEAIVTSLARHKGDSYYQQRLRGLMDELAQEEQQAGSDDSIQRAVESEKAETKADTNKDATSEPKAATAELVTEKVQTGRESTDTEKLHDHGIVSDKKGHVVLALELRLAAIEQAVGPPGKNLRAHVNDLARKIDVLYDPEHDMGAIKSEVRKLSKDLETLVANRRMAQLTLGHPPRVPPFEAKVDMLYAKLPEMERAAAAVPRVLARLRTLHHVHRDFAHSVSAIGEFDRTIHDLQRDVREWSTSLDDVSRSVDAHVDMFERNRAVAESRLAAMEQRVASLQ